MVADKLIKKLNEGLRRGDKKKIADETGISIATVNRFFNEDDDSINIELTTKIIDKAIEFIAKHKSKAKLSEKKIKKVTED